jgi:hypothetical protein
MTIQKTATGGFEIQMKPQALAHGDAAKSLGRFTLDKQYSGDLIGVASGEMLSAGTAIANSAGYVAIEHVRGVLHGRRGEFVLQHSSQMARGVPIQRIDVVPDSGTDELLGLSGSLTIENANGVHGYTFIYALPA